MDTNVGDFCKDNPNLASFKICSVCEKKANPGNYYHSHYGAVCCNGCRLFFLRLHKHVSEQGHHLECKADETCKSALNGKRWCLKCRFKKCLQVGMDLKKNQCHKEKRRRLMKGQRDRKNEEERKIAREYGSPGQSPGSSVENFHERNRPAHCSHDVIRKKSSGWILGNSKNTQVVTNKGFIRDFKDFQMDSVSGSYVWNDLYGLQTHPMVENRLKMKALDSYPRDSQEQEEIAKVLDSFALATSKLRMNFESTQFLISCHKGHKVLNKSFFILHLSNMMTFVSQYALSQSLFSGISPVDQRTLLRKNLPLYLQYILARYFSSETGWEQLFWMMEGHMSFDFKDVENLNCFEFDRVNETMSIFESQNLANEYKSLIKQVWDFFPFPHHLNGLLANVLLYSTHGKMKLSEPFRIRQIYDKMVRLFNLSQGQGHPNNYPVPAGLNNLSALIKLLKRMDTIFGQCLIHPEKSLEVRNVPETLYIPYTDTEELWLQQSLGELQTAYRSVHVPMDFLQEYIELLSGYKKGDPSRSFMDTWLRMSKERARHVLNIHSEYSDLPAIDQREVWMKNHMTGVALAGALLNTTMAGKEQLKGVLGHFGSDRSWEKQFTTILNLDTIRPVKLARVSKDILDGSSMMYFANLVGEISKLVRNEQLFQLMMLLVLLDTDEISLGQASLGGLMRIRQNYLKLFQRKLFSARCSFIEYSQFQTIVKKLRIFSKMLELFLT